MENGLINFVDLKSLPIAIGIHNRTVKDLRKSMQETNLPERQNLNRKERNKKLFYHI